ncbi:sulfatase domain-containing protein [Sarocladium implicatum]|nr:sulfatase domain-containing protein [Sarocladium implicatum]
MLLYKAFQISIVGAYAGVVSAGSPMPLQHYEGALPDSLRHGYPPQNQQYFGTLEGLQASITAPKTAEAPSPERKTKSPRPNVVFILTDDQDVHLNSLDFMPMVRRHLTEKGTTFARHYVTTAVCCPSRVNLWTGRASHNTNITDVKPPYGGYAKFVANGFNEDYLPVWLKEAGYNSYYIGKLFNGHSVDYYDSPYPAGFAGTDFLLDPYTYNYVNATFQSNQNAPRSYEGQYSTDVLAEKTYALLDQAISASQDKPFFLTTAPIAPHSNIEKIGGFADAKYGAPIPAARHEHLFEDEIVPRTNNWNPDSPSGANWLLNLPQQNETNVKYNDDFHRNRIRSLQAVDELVDGLITRLEAHDVLDNTYVVYSSDNGFHIGQHRLQPGKSCGYEEDTHVPMIIRGPGVAAGYTTDMVTTHTDMAPTFLEILGIPARGDIDGKAFPITKEGIETDQATVESTREHVAVEYWGFAGGEGIHDRTLHENNTYKAIRLVSKDFNVYYSIWCNNEHELYDMSRDPGQMDNLLSEKAAAQVQWLFGLPANKIVSRLDSLMLVLKSCKGETCRTPWRQLHPSGNVRSLKEALHPEFDDFYEKEQARVKFDFCWNGYWPEAEGIMFETAGKVLYERDGLNWDSWT